MLSRRSLVARLAAVAAGSSAIVISSRGESHATSTSGAGSVAHPGTSLASTTCEPIRADKLIAPLAVGARLVGGWSITSIGTVESGAAVLTLKSDQGRSQRVHICRRGEDSGGLSRTADFDLVVMNGGVGDLPTEENLAHAVAELGRAIVRNEGSPEMVALRDALSTHTERLALFSGMDGAHLR